jgi:hypothetical protein
MSEVRARKILIVANRTAGGEHLRRLVRARMSVEPAEFVLLVPATPPEYGLTWTESEANALAEWRMNEAIDRLRAAGAEVRGVVGDARPLDAISDVLRDEPFDEIVISTLPAGMSRWVRRDLPRRAQRRFAIPVTHVADAAAGRSDPLERVARARRLGAAEAS